MILTPTLEVSVPGMPVMTARGAVRAVPGDMANAEVTVDNVFAKPLTLKGNFCCSLALRLSVHIDTAFTHVFFIL